MTPEEIDRIVVGDVLKTPSGDYRVVREVGTGPTRGLFPDKPYYFAFAIRRCSWTGKAYTIMCRSQLYDWERVGLRIKLDSELDEQFVDDLNCASNVPTVLTCCHVRGVP